MVVLLNGQQLGGFLVPRLMADLGARAYRFSTSWSRVLPTGTGAINQRGLEGWDWARAVVR